MNGLATRRTLERITHRQEEPVLGPESFGLAFKEIQSPHDVEARKWFRRTLITVCVLAFGVVFMPDGLRARLNGWLGTPQPARAVDVEPGERHWNDFHERCLVIEHRLRDGGSIRSDHC